MNTLQVESVTVEEQKQSFLDFYNQYTRNRDTTDEATNSGFLILAEINNNLPKGSLSGQKIEEPFVEEAWKLLQKYIAEETHEKTISETNYFYALTEGSKKAVKDVITC